MDGIERLHYYNGRRLAAADFCVEQHYHIAMRRLLNQGLFTPGVVNGLEVKKADATHVLVAPGLALDPAGREIVVPDGPDEDRTIAVPAQPATKKLGGYFLVVRYREEQIPASEDPCAAPATPQAARIRESAELTWTEDYPAPSLCDPKRPSIDCAVVLALVTTTAACEISAIEVDIRQDSRPKNVSQISAFALEGEKDIDKDNPKILHFQISGGAPNWSSSTCGAASSHRPSTRNSENTTTNFRVSPSLTQIARSLLTATDLRILIPCWHIPA